ncbi:MAG: histone deacetylase family protein [Solirubrobacteraceae bacterium]|nr:MAG: histone deacetylase [Solirubrobacterales bacterium]
MAGLAYLRHPASLAHDAGSRHPERPERILAIERALAQRGWLGARKLDAPLAERSLITAVHSRQHLEMIEALCARGGGAVDADTVAGPGTFDAAMHAAGGAAKMVDILLSGEATAGFAGLRPPGHHAESERAMGFCFFNNVAVAARRALDAHGARRVVVFDWDVHHGNGTNDIFHASANVLYVSVHQSPLYPGTGQETDIGRGRGEGYTINLPVAPGAGDATWCSLTEHVVAPIVGAWQPDLILISAGYDAHRDDPLADCIVSDQGYAQMAGSMRRAADDLGVPVGVVLEGGYELAALSRAVVSTLEVMGADAAPLQPNLGVDPLALRAAGRLAGLWPVLAPLTRA